MFLTLNALIVFGAFMRLLDRILREDHVSEQGSFFFTKDAPSLSERVQQQRIPCIIATNRPKVRRLTAEFGQS